MASSLSDCEERLSRARHGLNTINEFIQKYLQVELRKLFQHLPRITDVDHPFFNCLSDSKGQPLRFAPGGDGVKLRYKALPHYELTVQQRKQNLQQTKIQQQSQDIKKLLQAKNQPIPIQDENELAFIYIQEYYNQQPVCNILNLDPSATLTILSKAQCFADAIKKQAAKVRDEVRNPLSHQIITEWTPDRLNEAFLQIRTLAKMMPNNGGLLQKLEDDLTLHKETLDFINNYLENVQMGNIPEVFIPSLTINKLPNNQNERQPIFIPRRFLKVADQKLGRDEKTHIYDNIEDILEPGRTCLIRGESGMGKSYFTSHLISEWASKKCLTKSRLCIHIPCRLLEKEARLPMGEMIFEYSSLKGTTGKTALPFSKIETLSKNGELSFIIDGLDEVEKISDAELGAIMTKVAEAKKDHTTPVTAIELIVAILRKQIFNNSTVFAAGRPLAIDMVNKKILKNRSTIVDLLEFTEDNIVDLVHKLSCSDNVKCKESNLPLCHEIIKGIKDNTDVEILAKNPALCTSLIKMFKDRVEHGENINFYMDSGCSLQIEILLRNITHKHSDPDEDISFTTLDEEISESLFEAAMLSYKSLVKGEFIMRGTKETIGNKALFVPEIGGNSISLEHMEQMQLFRIVEDKHGQMAVETTHLIIQETLAASIFAVKDKGEMLKSLCELNLDRLSAIMSYMSSLLKPKSINANFLQFMRKRSKVKAVNNIERLQELYTIILNLPLYSPLGTDGNEGFPFYYNNRKLSDYQVYLIARMVSISGVKCPGLSLAGSKKSGKQSEKSQWILFFDKLGFGPFRTSPSQTRDLLKFVDLQSFPPGEIHIKDECYKGALSIIKSYLELHPGVSLKLTGDRKVELYTQSDIMAYHWLTKRGYINPEMVSWLLCSAKLDDEVLSLVLPVMLQEKKINVSCDQTDKFWQNMNQAMVNGEHNVTQLELEKLTVRESAIDDAFGCLMCVSTIGLFDMQMEENKWTKLSQRLAQSEKLGTVKSLLLAKMVLTNKIIECASNVEGVGLLDINLDVVARDYLSAALQRDYSKTKIIELTRVKIEERAITSFRKCLKNIKTIALRQMNITEALTEGLNSAETIELHDLELEPLACNGLANGLRRENSKIKTIQLIGIKFAAGASKYFRKCLTYIEIFILSGMDITKNLAVGCSSVKTIVMDNMELDAAACDGLAKGLSSGENRKTEELELTGVKIADGAAKSFTKYLRHINSIQLIKMKLTEELTQGLSSVKKISIFDIKLDATVCEYLAKTLSREDSKTETMELKRVIFAHGAIKSFSKCLKKIKSLFVIKMEMVEELAMGMKSVGEVRLKNIQLDAKFCNSLANALSMEDSKTENIQLTKITFAPGAVESFNKCLRYINIISMEKMEVVEGLAVGLTNVEIVLLQDIQFEAPMIDGLADALSREHSKTKTMQLARVTFTQKPAKSFNKCLKNIKIIILIEIEITEILAVGLSSVERIDIKCIQLDAKMCDNLTDALSTEDSKTQTLSITRITFAQGAAQSFGKCLRNIETFAVLEMEITKDLSLVLSSENNKTKLLALYSIHVEETDEATEYFVNCIVNTAKEVQMEGIHLKENQWDQLSNALNNSQQKKIKKLILTTSWGTPFVPRRHCIDISSLNDMNFPSSATPITCSFYHRIFAPSEL